MKKRLSRVRCFALVLIMLVGMIPATSPRVHAASQSQMNAVARADYMYNATWVCQQTVAGWGDTFYAGNTYHIPYGQPINSGKYVGYAASVEEFLEAAATPGSVFYTGRSYYTGTTAPYYVTDCSSFVSWCWGISRTTTYYIPSVSTKIGAATTHNCTYNLQLGDALNHPDHVVMVTGLSYDAGGAISQIEITEQTPPQMKRSYYTPSQLADKYGAYTIYRYYGEVPAAPNTTVLEGWQFIDGNWYYYVGNARTTGWLNDNGTWYYLDANGIMQTGWLDDNGTWYYLETNGAMQTGWLKIDGYWYYFKPVNGMMQTGWIYVDGCWYYMDKESGRMRTGWVYDENTWYYLNPANGVMQTGWITVDGATYYLNPDGGMVTGNQTISGIPYQFSSSGALILGTYPGGMAGDSVIYAEGVDISYWNGENCNLQAVKDAGFDYVIIRAGSTNLGQDVYFETFYNRARAVGLDIGVYFYSYATTVEGAIADANKCLSFIAGKTFEYPIYFDYEDPCQDNLDQSLQTQICLAFMDTLSASGYVTGLCSYAAKIAGMDMDTIGAKYECWIANYVDDWHTTKDPEYSSKYGMYQYSNEKYAGSVGPFDADVSYKDYPSIMKRYGLNGYTKETEDVTCNHETHDIYGNCYMCDQYVGHSYANGVCTGCDLRCSHSYTDGVCMVCGGVEPGFAPTLTGKSFSLSFEDEILVNFYYTISDMANVTEHGMLVFYEDPGRADYSQADAVYTDSVYDAVKNRYMNTTDGVAAKEMGDGRFYAAYARLSDGSYVYSSLYNYSPQKYAMNMLGKSSTSESQKALCVAMLNYGAAAQTYFGYKPDSLMNTSLTDAQRGLVVPYSADLLKGAVAADNSKAGAFAKTASGFSKKTVSVSFDGAFGVNYYFTASNVPEGEMTFYYWTAEDYAAVQTLTAHSATGTVVMEIAENGSYWAMVDGIAAKEIDDTIYVAGVYTDCSGFVSYCWDATYKQSTRSLASISNEIGEVTTYNCTYNLQLGDALNRYDYHVVLVTGLSYDASGAITQIEITESAIPTLKRSYYTPYELAMKYSSYDGIYRYYGTVDPAPNSDRWERDDTGWWYEYADGSYAIGWTMIDGSWYYFNQSGYMLTGWLYDHNYQAWYYFDPNSGKMQTGWLYLEGYCYYLNSDGQMLTGWQMIDGNWFYLNTTDKWPAGAMFTGFHEIDGKMYYFNERSDGTRGAMLKGWVEVNGNWYYFDGSGAMLYGWQQINGNWYHLDEESGIMSVNAWFYKDGVWQYVNANGAVTEGAQWSSVFENGLDMGTGFYATIDIPLTGTRVGADSNPDSATYQNVEVQAVREKTAADYNEQLWYFERRDDDGSYRITNAATGMCLDQLGGYVDMGTNVRVCPNYESLAQRWFVFANGDHYGFVSACSAWDMTVLDVVDGRGDEGTNIRIWSNNGTGAQQFVVNRIPETTVTSKSFSLSFEDEILVNLYYTVSDLSDVIEHGMLTFYTNPDTVDIANADAVYSEPVYDSAKDRYMATTDGIPAKQMGDTRYYVAYAKLSDGSYVYSKVYDYSPKKYAMNMLGKASTSEKQKALCVAMLNYGASVQQYFGYNTDNLMNADLTDAQKALVVAYDKTLFTGSVRADSGKIGGFAATNGFSKKTATVSFDSAFAINYYFTPNAAMDSELAFYYWTAQDYNAAATLTAGNASGKLVMEDNGNGVYWAQVTGIAAKQLDDTYYVAGIYTDAGGNTCSTGVVAYSLSKYCMGKAVDGNEMQQLAAATAMYGYYAKLYFTA